MEILIAIYKPNIDELRACFAAIAAERANGIKAFVRLWHNDGGPDFTPGLQELYENYQSSGIDLEISGDQKNLGFGQGINALLAKVQSSYILILNQDAIPEPGALKRLYQIAINDKQDVAAWEMRQIPYEHPKAYDPVSLETEWVSGAAVLFRTEAVRALGGFESKIFMYGEDVELSWRLRCVGWRLRYQPQCAVLHSTYTRPNEVKPIQALEGIYANLALRARYSGRRRVIEGIVMALGELAIPQPFPGRRMGIIRAIVKFLKNYRHFRGSHMAAPWFEPRFSGWGYELRREGAFHPFESERQQLSERPLVSILIRTHKRGAFLREALTSICNQTWRPVEAVVVEDGSDQGRSVCEEFNNRLDIRYFRLDPAKGRSAAGNYALAHARGEWIGFLDDDDLLFADHVEVLLQTAREKKVLGAYGLAWRTRTRILDNDAPHYEELMMDIHPDEPFSRVSMWHHNFIPIQSLVFHRSLYEKYGGFEENMEQLEDWNLWTRFTIDEEFVQLRKVTSKYRVPAESGVLKQRQAKLDAAYRDAVARQSDMRFSATPTLVRHLAEEYARSNALIHIGKDSLRLRIARTSWLAKIAAARSLAFRWRR